jgi:hypothetical protein
MAELTPAPSINDARTQALMPLIARLGALDLAPLLVYRIESVPCAVLPFLAWQFDVISPVWQLVAPAAISIDALTNIDALIDIDNLLFAPGTPGVDAADEAQRELLEAAIELHRYHGTPSSIRRALSALGWSNVSFLEGEATWGGTSYPSDQGWAAFRVVVNLAGDDNVPAGAAPAIATAANFFKPARCLLDSVWFALGVLSDATPAPTDLLTFGGIAELQIDSAPVASDNALTLSIVQPLAADSYGPIAPLYNNHYRHSGITYGQNEPVVADPALILNGAAVLDGG